MESESEENQVVREGGLRCVRHCLDRVEYLEVLVELLVDERAVIPSDKQYVSPITFEALHSPF